MMAEHDALDAAVDALDRDALLGEMRKRRAAADAASKVVSDAAGAQFVAAVEGVLAGQRTPPAQGAPRADALMEAVDAAIRAQWGPLPWVRYTQPGRVLSVNAAAHTCTVRLPEDGAAGQPDVSGIRTVRTGIGLPAVGKTYAVHFPYRLPDAPTALMAGPVPAGDPWLKAPSGQTWIYYAAAIPTGGFGWYRVPLPPPDDPTFAYSGTAALLVARQGTRPPDYINWGGSNLTGIAPSYFSQHLWMEDSGWPGNRAALYEDFGVVRPLRTLLRRYPHWGADPDAPAGQDEPGLLTSYPWLHLTGTDLDPAGDADRFFGAQHAVEPLTLPVDNPTFRDRLASIRLTLASSVGGTTWSVRSPIPLYSEKTKITYDAVNGYHAGVFNYVEGEMADAAGWVNGATSPWGLAGDRIAYWAVQQLTPDPFPNELEIVPITPDSAANFIIDRFNLSPSRIRLFIGRNGGDATEVTLPGQPLGWVDPYPGFALRPTGGGAVRAWWCGMPSLVQTRPGGAGHPIVITATPRRLWRGEIDLVHGAATWTQMASPALNQLLAVNGDARVVLAALRTEADGDISGTEIVYLTQDAGATWTRLPPLPYFTGWGESRLVARLIDTP